jgi:hypothetical protein
MDEVSDVEEMKESSGLFWVRYFLTFWAATVLVIMLVLKVVEGLMRG